MTWSSRGWIKPPGPIAPGLRIGLLGGSFNPPHAGHVHVSELALKRLGLDYVWWLVSPQNPLKSSRETAPIKARLLLAGKLVHERRLIVTDVELVLGTRFTVDTLSELKRRFRQVRFVWLMGSDNLAGFHRWKDWPRIIREMPVAIIMRPGSNLAPLQAKAMQRFWRFRQRKPRALARACPPAIAIVGGPRNRQSSTAIRQASQTW